MSPLVLQLGVAAAYLLLARMVHGYFTDSIASVLWPPSGLALAVILLGGPRYAWGVFLGAFVTHIISDGTLWTAPLVALGNTLEALVGAWLLNRNGKFDIGLSALNDYTRLVFWGGGVAGLVGTAVGPTVLLIAGIFSAANFPLLAMQWWMGDVLGAVLVAPLILVWRKFPEEWLDWKRAGEVVLFFGLAFLAGQVVFLGWAQDTFGFFARSFLMFLFVIWAAVRLGMHGVLLMLLLVAVQALRGAFLHVGAFGHDIEHTQLVNFWVYIVTLSLVGMLLAGFISAEKRDKHALSRQEAFFHLIADSIDDFIAVLDLAGRRQYSSPAYDKLFGAAWRAEGKDCLDIIHQDDRERVRRVLREAAETGDGRRMECRFVLPDGTVREMESRVGLMRDDDGRVSRVVVISHDITVRKRAEESIRSLAFYDTLTMLPNRRLLEDRLAQAMAACQRNSCYGAVIFLDLNNFKPLNDEYGHDLGDQLLVEVAKRLTLCVRKMDTVARYGGDEFVVVLSELASGKQNAATEALAVAEKIQAALSVIYQLEYVGEDGRAAIVGHSCSASIGCTLFSGRESGQEVLLKWADTAMYQAKKNGEQHICFPENAEDVTQSGRLVSRFCYARVCGCAARR